LSHCRVGSNRLLEGVKRGLERGVAHGMHSHAEASFHCGPDAVGQVREGDASANRLATYLRVNGRGDTAIGEELQRTDSEPLVPLAGRGAVEAAAVEAREQSCRVRHGENREW
jgi:hypothetical protein